LLQNARAGNSIKENPRGIPSLGTSPLVGGENFFDGSASPNTERKMDGVRNCDRRTRSRSRPTAKASLLEKLNKEMPKKLDGTLGAKCVPATTGCCGIQHAKNPRQHVQS